MKKLSRILVLLTLCVSVFAKQQSLPNPLQDLVDKYHNRMEIYNVNDDTIRDGNNQKIEVFKFNTRQDKRDKLDYQLRITVQFTDRKTKEKGYAQKKYTVPPAPETYTGATDWEFQIPYGHFERPKISAYVIEFGFLKDNVFVPVAVESHKAETAKEIIDAGGSELAMERTKFAHWIYTDVSTN